MSDKPELSGLQLWILRAQREILLKGDLGRENRSSTDAHPTLEQPIVEVRH